MQAWLIVAEDRFSQAGGAAECRRVRDTNNLEHVRVLYPKDLNVLPNAGLNSRHFHYVLSPGAKVFHKRQFDDGTFEPAIRQALNQ